MGQPSWTVAAAEVESARAPSLTASAAESESVGAQPNWNAAAEAESAGAPSLSAAAEEEENSQTSSSAGQAAPGTPNVNKDRPLPEIPPVEGGGGYDEPDGVSIAPRAYQEVRILFCLDRKFNCCKQYCTVDITKFVIANDNRNVPETIMFSIFFAIS